MIEAPRALPVLDENDYRKINYYVQNFYQQKNSVSGEGGFLSRLFSGKANTGRRESAMVTEVIGRHVWQRYENRELVAEGMSDVEQLIGLQDELNTRLSDRASRITFQAFKMYLAKGVAGFEDKPVSPGRMWFTDNLDASIEQFGGDDSTPSEDMHITEIREAMDKVSGVTPVVAGVLKNKLGNLNKRRGSSDDLYGYVSVIYEIS